MSSTPRGDFSAGPEVTKNFHHPTIAPPGEYQQSDLEAIFKLMAAHETNCAAEVADIVPQKSILEVKIFSKAFKASSGPHLTVHLDTELLAEEVDMGSLCKRDYEYDVTVGTFQELFEQLDDHRPAFQTWRRADPSQAEAILVKTTSADQDRYSNTLEFLIHSCVVERMSKLEHYHTLKWPGQLEEEAYIREELIKALAKNDDPQRPSLGMPEPQECQQFDIEHIFSVIADDRTAFNVLPVTQTIGVTEIQITSTIYAANPGSHITVRLSENLLGDILDKLQPVHNGKSHKKQCPGLENTVSSNTHNSNTPEINLETLQQLFRHVKRLSPLFIGRVVDDAQRAPTLVKAGFRERWPKEVPVLEFLLHPDAARELANAKAFRLRYAIC